jgi:hypothetical protein
MESYVVTLKEYCGEGKQKACQTAESVGDYSQNAVMYSKLYSVPH